jgi:hypothetical protein
LRADGRPDQRGVSERLQLEAVADGAQRLADGITVGRVVYDSSVNEHHIRGRCSDHRRPTDRRRSYEL